MRSAETSVVAAVVRKALRADFIGVGERHGQKLKAVISAGALHPVKAIIVSSDQDPLLYDDESDRFLALPVLDRGRYQAFLLHCREVLPNAQGHWISMIAECRDLSRVYSNYDSLLWRDAGAVIQTMALTAEAHDLVYCPLGILGHEIVAALRASSSDLVAVGVAAIGVGESV